MVGELRKVEDENCLHRDGCQHGLDRSITQEEFVEEFVSAC